MKEEIIVNFISLWITLKKFVKKMHFLGEEDRKDGGANYIFLKNEFL